MYQLTYYYSLLIIIVTILGTNSWFPHSVNSQLCGRQRGCGNDVMMSYPFWPLSDPGENQTQCGYPGFGFNCSSRGDPILTISNDLYHVLQSQEQSLLIVNREFHRKTCPRPRRNFTIDPATSDFFVDKRSRNSTFFFNCTSPPPPPPLPPSVTVKYEKYHLACLDSSDKERTYGFLDYDMNPKLIEWSRNNCKESITVPIVLSRFGDLFSDYSLQKGFMLSWTTPIGCRSCESSGGQCLFNKRTKHVNCTCPYDLQLIYGGEYGRGDYCSSPRNGGSPNNNSIITKTGGIPSSSNNNNIDTKAGGSPNNNSIITKTGGIPSSNNNNIDTKAGGIRKKLLIGVFTGVGGLIVLFLLFVYCKNRKKGKEITTKNVELFLESYGCRSLQRYKYKDIKKMTNTFKDKLGQGGYGSVFKGKLADGRFVAVKILINDPKKTDGDEFINEVATIGGTNHVNIVTLLGFCSSGSKRALVYEFMPNGSLEKFIYTEKEKSNTNNTAVTTPTDAKHALGWEKLYQIALGIARGLEYLHRGCNTRILHFDIKPHNVLLDENFCPKISDFGLAKLCPTRESVISTLGGARGTIGYIAPEVCYRTFGRVSYKSDVYSYGMMVLEMVGGRKNMDPLVDNVSEMYFPDWIYNHLEKQNGKIEGLLRFENTIEEEMARSMVMVSLWCIQANSTDRPTMSRVAEMLEGSIQDMKMPPKPFMGFFSSSSASSSSTHPSSSSTHPSSS